MKFKVKDTLSASSATVEAGALAQYIAEHLVDNMFIYAKVVDPLSPERIVEAARLGLWDIVAQQLKNYGYLMTEVGEDV